MRVVSYGILKSYIFWFVSWYIVCVIVNCLNNSGLLNCYLDVCGVNCGNVYKGGLFFLLLGLSFLESENISMEII